LTVGLPSSFSDGMYEAFLSGFERALGDFGIVLVGGDTVRSGILFFSLTVLGKTSGRPVLRSGAQVGDNIYVTGILGESALGLEALLGKEIPVERKEDFVFRHLYPPCRIGVMQTLVSSYSVTAAIDCSDGFVADLDHIADESGVGYEVHIERIPVPEKERVYSPFEFPLSYALGGGEDYEIIFTSPEEIPSVVEGVPVTCVGKVVSDERQLLWYGKRVAKENIHRGYTHF
ncbi:MAG: thiamine-phosphate kinase, partial [Brevinematales bacterium]